MVWLHLPAGSGPLVSARRASALVPLHTRQGPQVFSSSVSTSKLHALAMHSPLPHMAELHTWQLGPQFAAALGRQIALGPVPLQQPVQATSVTLHASKVPF